MKRFYECTFIVNPGLDDTQIQSTIKMAEDSVVKNGGEMVNIEHVGRRRLAYPISKKHNGYYISIEFEGEGRIIEKVERFLTLDENVMRYLTVQLDPRELEAKRSRVAIASQERSRDHNGPSASRAAVAPKSDAADAPKSEAAAAPKSEAADAPKSDAADAPKSDAADAPKSEAADAPKSEAADAPKSEAAETAEETEKTDEKA
jgi:small subunit ribosomal protein S6